MSRHVPFARKLRRCLRAVEAHARAVWWCAAALAQRPNWRAVLAGALRLAPEFSPRVWARAVPYVAETDLVFSPACVAAYAAIVVHWDGGRARWGRAAARRAVVITDATARGADAVFAARRASRVAGGA